MKFVAALFAFVAVTVTAAPGDRLGISKRQSATTCGSTSYSSSEVSSAAAAACNFYSSGDEAGSSDYPHQYNNFEGFDFPVPGPYQEFPIVPGHTYNGGSPGADRVVINDDCQYAGAITHTGASGNDFVGCSGTS